MSDEKALFDQIREEFCQIHHEVTEGKMMSSPAIHYQNKVFAFFSRRNNMVFKLGKDFQPDDSLGIGVFSPFKSKKPLTGWIEVPHSQHHLWTNYTEKALAYIKNN